MICRLILLLFIVGCEELGLNTYGLVRNNTGSAAVQGTIIIQQNTVIITQGATIVI